MTEEQETASHLSLWQKIAKAREIVEVVKKEGKVAFGKTNYNYQRAEDIELAVREALIKVGLVLLPVNFDVVSDTGNIITTIQNYQLVDVDSGDAIILSMGGMGQDSGDKRIYKAETGAFKYLLKQLFMIPSEDTDPDLTPSGIWEQNKRVQQQIKTTTNENTGETTVDTSSVDWKSYVCPYGKNKGKTLGELASDNLGKGYIRFMADRAGDMQPYCLAAKKELGL